MSEIIDLSNRRPSIFYTIEIEHRWNGAYSFLVRDLADDARSRKAVRELLLAIADDIRAGEILKDEADPISDFPYTPGFDPRAEVRDSETGEVIFPAQEPDPHAQ